MKPTKMQIAEWVQTADRLDNCLALAFAAGMEAAAQMCETLVDSKEYERATTRANEAIREGDEGQMLQRLRHQGDVRLYNAGIEKCAAAIRKAKEES